MGDKRHTLGWRLPKTICDWKTQTYQGGRWQGGRLHIIAMRFWLAASNHCPVGLSASWLYFLSVCWSLHQRYRRLDSLMPMNEESKISIPTARCKTEKHLHHPIFDGIAWQQDKSRMGQAVVLWSVKTKTLTNIDWRMNGQSSPCECYPTLLLWIPTNMQYEQNSWPGWRVKKHCGTTTDTALFLKKHKTKMSWKDFRKNGEIMQNWRIYCRSWKQEDIHLYID